MSGGDIVRQSMLDNRWSLLAGPHGTGFTAMPGVPTATPWSIMDRTDAEANAHDVGMLNRLKIIGIGRDGAAETFLAEFWGYHEDGPPDFLGLLTFTLGSVTPGTDATFLDADIAKMTQGVRSGLQDGASWFGADTIVVTTAGVFGAGIFSLSTAVATKMNLMNVILNLKNTGHSHIGVHLVSGTAAAGALLYVPVD